MQKVDYRVHAGPEGYLPPAAASMGVVLPDEGKALIEGVIFSEEEAMEKIAGKLLSAKNPLIHQLRDKLDLIPDQED